MLWGRGKDQLIALLPRGKTQEFAYATSVASQAGRPALQPPAGDDSSIAPSATPTVLDLPAGSRSRSAGPPGRREITCRTDRSHSASVHHRPPVVVTGSPCGSWRSLQRAEHAFGIAGDDGQIGGPGWSSSVRPCSQSRSVPKPNFRRGLAQVVGVIAAGGILPGHY